MLILLFYFSISLRIFSIRPSRIFITIFHSFVILLLSKKNFLLQFFAFLFFPEFLHINFTHFHQILAHLFIASFSSKLFIFILHFPFYFISFSFTLIFRTFHSLTFHFHIFNKSFHFNFTFFYTNNYAYCLTVLYKFFDLFYIFIIYFFLYSHYTFFHFLRIFFSSKICITMYVSLYTLTFIINNRSNLVKLTNGETIFPHKKRN